MAKSIRISGLAQHGGQRLLAEEPESEKGNEKRLSISEELAIELGIGRHDHGILTYTPDAAPEGDGDAVEAALMLLESIYPGKKSDAFCNIAQQRAAAARAEYERIKRERDDDSEALRDALAELARMREEREGERVVTVEIEPDPSGDSLMRRVVMHEPGRTDPWSFRLSEEGVRTLVGSNRAGYKYDLAIRRVEEKAKVVPVKMLCGAGGYVFWCPACKNAFLVDPARNKVHHWPALFNGPYQCPGCDMPWGEPRDLPGNLT